MLFVSGVPSAEDSE